MLAWSAALRSFYLKKHPLFISLSPPAVHHSCLRALFLISPLCSLLAFCYLLKLSVFSLPVGQHTSGMRDLCVFSVLFCLSWALPHLSITCTVSSVLLLYVLFTALSSFRPLCYFRNETGVCVRLKSRQRSSSSNLH